MHSNSTINFTILQTPVHDTKQANTDQLRRLMDCEAVRKADFVTLPEMWNCPYYSKAFPVFAEPEGGDSWQLCSDLAREYGVYLAAGSMPEIEDGRVYNTAYVFDREGRQIAKHRKVHLFDIDVKGGQHFKGSDTLTAGDSFDVFETEFCRMGICVCYDFRFPEGARLLAQDGAKVILVPASFNMTTGPAHWELMFRQRAVEDQVYTVGTAPARDQDGKYVSWAHSIVCDPWGRVVNQLGDRPGAMSVTLDLGMVESVREELPLLKHRRTDVYELRRVKGDKE